MSENNESFEAKSPLHFCNYEDPIIERKLRILHVIAPGPTAGAERSALASVKALRDAGHSAELAIIKELRNPTPADDFEILSKELSIPARIVPSTQRVDIKMFQCLAELIRSSCYDIVHCHGYKALLHLIMMRAPMPPLVVTHHGFTSHNLLERVYEWLEWKAYQKVDCLFVVSKGSRDSLYRRGGMRCRMVIVPNIVAQLVTECKTGNKKDKSGVSMLFLGRLSREKGLDILLEALRSLKFMKIKLDVVGDGPDRNILEMKAIELGLEKHICFYGFQRDVSPYLAAADILVMPSRTEGMPMALLEAAGSGIPVIASKVGGIPEITKHNENGLLVSPENPEQLQQSIIEMTNNLDRFRETATNYIPMIMGEYGPKRWVERAEIEYRAIIHEAL